MRFSRAAERASRGRAARGPNGERAGLSKLNSMLPLAPRRYAAAAGTGPVDVLDVGRWPLRRLLATKARSGTRRRAARASEEAP